MKMIGCVCLLVLRMFRKKELAEAKITLWTSNCWPSSQARVTSVKSLSSLRSWKAEQTLLLKLLHWRENFSDNGCILKFSLRSGNNHKQLLECKISNEAFKKFTYLTKSLTNQITIKRNNRFAKYPFTKWVPQILGMSTTAHIRHCFLIWSETTILNNAQTVSQTYFVQTIRIRIVSNPASVGR